MENSKKIVLKCGHYSLNPKDAEEKTGLVPEDAIFFTGGEREVGDSKHEGAYHIMIMSKASDDILKNAATNFFNASVVMFRNEKFGYDIFRVNGYGFIHIYDCIPVEGIEFTDADEVNRLLDLENHPVYTVLFNDDCAICDVSRINRINSYHNVECTNIQVYSQIGSRYYPMIHSKTRSDLRNVIVPFHEFMLCFPDEQYGKELFDEAMYIALGEIYPEMKEKLVGYDFEHLKNCWDYMQQQTKICNKVFNMDKNDEEISQEISKDLEEFEKTYPVKPDSEGFNEMLLLKKKLPIKKQS